MNSSPGREEDSRLEAEAEVFTEGRAQVRLALRLVQVAERADLAAVARAGADLLGDALVELRVARIGVALGGERRPDPRAHVVGIGGRRLLDRERRLAAIAARDDRARRDVAEPHAALLRALGAHVAGEDDLARVEGLDPRGAEHRDALEPH